MFGIERARIDLLWELVKAHFKIKYNNSVLGFLWVFLKPFFLFVILYTVWTRFAGGESIENYGVYLLLGLIMYTLFTDGITLGMRSLLDGAEIILHINYPRQINVMVAIIMSVINYLISIIIFILFGLISGFHPTVFSFLYFVFISIILVAFITAASLILSIALIWLRDLDNINELAMRLLLFATPILYSVETRLGKTDILSTLILGNPLGLIINTARDAAIYGKISNPELMMAYAVAAVVINLIAWRFFSYQVIKVAEHF